jgi:hypothetical protein
MSVARHPLTGKEIRILTSDASVWRDQKTIVWLSGSPPPAAWGRWDVGATSTAAADALEAAGIQSDIVLCLDEDQAAAAAWLRAGHWERARLTVVPKALADSIGMEELLALKISNMICLEEMTDLYPHTEHKWDGTLEDAKLLVALALRSARTFPVLAPPARASLAARRGLTCLEDLQTPPPLYWITQYYKPDKSRRRREIDACLAATLECPYVDRVVLLNETACAPEHPKIEEHVIGTRLTYATVLRWIRDKVPQNAIVAFANSDIFPETASWRSLWSMALGGPQPKFLALLRWDVEGTTAEAQAAAKLFGPRPDSQDTWIVAASAIQTNPAAFQDLAPFEFSFGRAGCDNAITIEMLKKKFAVSNPALSLRTFHFHSSQVRGYDPRDCIDKPAYLYINPTGVHDMNPVRDLKALCAAPAKSISFEGFDRPVRGPLTPAQAKTFCAMLAKATQNEVVLDPEDANHWVPPPVPVYPMKEVFQTRDGLVYGYNAIAVGQTKASAEAWAECQLSSMSSALRTTHSFVAPINDAIAKDAGAYVLQYLSKVFLMREQFPATAGGEFWCAKKPECIEALKMFDWPNREVPVLSRDENQQVWCEEAAVWMRQDTPAGLITREEVAALRAALRGWRPDAEEERKIVLIVNPSGWFTEDVVDRLEAALESGLRIKVIYAGSTSLDRTLEALSGAWGVVLGSPTLAASWAWVLPKGATVWEVQSEMAPRVDLLHLSAAAGLTHQLAIVPKGAPTQVEKDALVAKLVASIQAAARGGAAPPSAPLLSERPRLLLPTVKTGFFAHAGDSFREMARIWAEKGWVELVETPLSVQVWLGGIGQVLLYDRPTLEWLDSAPKAQRSWKTALFGNPAPPAAAGGRAWTFWPRRPRLVEDAVASGLPATPFEARPRRCVFYGRSENTTQLERRSKHDWSTVCDEFQHDKGAAAAATPYTLSPMEYLQRLSQAQFGLCLAGYGRKCHREIECMAMGCVPIVAEEVDMESYAQPPVAGTHYFRVKGPEEVKHILATVTAERWAQMSAACRAWWAENASAEGSWRLTQRLAQASA